MLATPQYGWSEITIGDWHDRCSYLDDVSYELLEAVDATNRTGRPHCVKFDAEGWEYIIVFGMYETHIIHCNFEGEYHYYTIEIHIKDLARELLSDIRKDLDLWAEWPYSASEDEISERKRDLSVWCDAIEKRL